MREERIDSIDTMEGILLSVLHVTFNIPIDITASVVFPPGAHYI